MIGTNGNSSIHNIMLPVTTAQMSSSPLYIPQNGAKVENSSSGDQVMTENEQDSPLYKFLKENRDMLKNMSSSHHRTSPGIHFLLLLLKVHIPCQKPLPLLFLK